MSVDGRGTAPNSSATAPDSWAFGTARPSEWLTDEDETGSPSHVPPTYRSAAGTVAAPRHDVAPGRPAQSPQAQAVGQRKWAQPPPKPAAPFIRPEPSSSNVVRLAEIEFRIRATNAAQQWLGL